ncbi:MAG TPA: hypothetical protein VMA30_04370 [Xanthobacteraceae bacterium]|nr:hypothetical protein [Xanthobacteraceae bacterium]
MLRSTQLRFGAIVLFAVAAALLVAAPARAFSVGNGGAAGSNSGFADPDEQIGKMFGLDGGGEASSLGSPAQFDPRAGKSNPYKHFHFDTLTTPPDPLSRLSN